MYRAGLPDCLTEKKQDNIRLRHPKPHQPPSRHCHCHLQLYRVVIRRNLFFAVTKLHQKRSDHNGNGEYVAFEDSSLLEWDAVAGRAVPQDSTVRVGFMCAAWSPTMTPLRSFAAPESTRPTTSVRPAASPCDPKTSAAQALWPYSHVPTWTCNKTHTL